MREAWFNISAAPLVSPRGIPPSAHSALDGSRENIFAGLAFHLHKLAKQSRLSHHKLSVRPRSKSFCPLLTVLLLAALPFGSAVVAAQGGDDQAVQRSDQPSIGVSPPTILSRIDPQYSEEARVARLVGTVGLSIVVDSGGLPRDIHIVRPLGLGLDEKAISAVRQWRFHPGSKDGKPVAVRAGVDVNFRLSLTSPDHWYLARATFAYPASAQRPTIKRMSTSLALHNPPQITTWSSI
jgi:TonB family protein